jgi:hypothetical protein
MRTFNRLLLTGLDCTRPMAAMAAECPSRANPEVTIRTEGDKTIEEYRQNGFPVCDQGHPEGRTTVLPGTRGRHRRELHPL